MTNTYIDRVSTAIKEIIATGEKQINIAKVLGVSRSTVNTWINGTVKSGINAETAMKIEKYYGYRARWLMSGELPKTLPKENEIIPDERWEAIKLIDMKLKAGITGFGVEYLDEKKFEPLFFKRTWFEKRGYNPNKLYALLVKGESMSPTLEDGFVVVVNTELTSPKDNTIFAINYHGEAVIKRLIRDMGGFWMVSDNTDQRKYPRVLCDENTLIIGKIVHYQGEL